MYQGLIDPRSGERACNSAYACRDGKMLVVTKNRTKRVGGWQRQLCSLQAVGALEFFGELYSLAKRFWPIFEGVWAGFREREGSIFSNHQHFAVSTGICGVACPRVPLKHGPWTGPWTNTVRLKHGPLEWTMDHHGPPKTQTRSRTSHLLVM